MSRIAPNRLKSHQSGNVRSEEKPFAIVFFATPDVLSGLSTLASYDDPRVDAVITLFGAGCATIVHYPYHDGLTDSPRAARGCVPHDRLTFAVPWKRFLTMVANMDESFLITPSWAKVRERIRKHSAQARFARDTRSRVTYESPIVTGAAVDARLYAK